MNNNDTVAFLNKNKDISDKDIYIAISLEEYKELLITKGKYKELKNKEKIQYKYIPVKSTTETDI